MGLAAMTMQSDGMQSIFLEMMVIFDTNSFPIGFGHICTGCISNRIKDFKIQMVKSDTSIKGFGGSSTTGIIIETLT